MRNPGRNLSLRTRLILSVALVHALLMCLFVVDLVHRQRAGLLQLRLDSTRSLARTLALSSSGWMLARDLAGLQEIIAEQESQPELEFAMLLDAGGRILAHTEAGRLGQFALPLPDPPRSTLLELDDRLVDVIEPVWLGQELLGWARVGLGQRRAARQLNQAVLDGALYSVAAILLGSLLALAMGTRITRRLERLRAAVRDVRLGLREQRAPELGEDEVGQLGRDFNHMLDRLDGALLAQAESEERFRLAAEATQLGLWDWKLQDGGFFASREWCGHLGLERAPDRLEEWLQLVHEDERPALEEALAGCRGGERRFLVLECRSRHADGEWRWIRHKAELRRDAQGLPLRLVGTSQDISEARREAVERAEFQRRLQQMQKMEALGQLTGGIAHDFNNMLAIMLGNVELACRQLGEAGPPEARTCLAAVLKAGERARELVGQMLTYARGGSGREDVVEPGPVVEEVVRLLRASLPATLELTLTVEPDLPAVRVDPVELQQCVTNLCVNARDALEGRGQVEVRVGRRRVEDTCECPACHQTYRGDFIEVSVRDNGPGIPDEVLPRVFDPFFTTKEVGKGTGMGLSVVYGIARRRGGHLHVETRAGSGTRLGIRLPVSQTWEPSPPPRPEERSALTDEALGWRIFVVDDEEALGALFANLLTYQGCSVRRFQDPLQALEAFQEDPRACDALVSDQTMPRMTGLELASRMRELRPALPVILMSGYSDKLSLEEARKRHINHFLPKPVRLNHLLECLQAELGEPARRKQESCPADS